MAKQITESSFATDTEEILNFMSDGFDSSLKDKMSELAFCIGDAKEAALVFSNGKLSKLQEKEISDAINKLDRILEKFEATNN